MPFGSGGRTRWILLVALVLLVGLAVAGWSLLREDVSTAGAPTATPTAAAGAPSASPLTSPRAAVLSEQLTSGDETELRAALAMPSGQALDPAVAKQLASLGSISFDLATFAYLDGQTAEVQGTVATPPTGVSPRWTFTLIHLGNEWMLVDGRPSP